MYYRSCTYKITSLRLELSLKMDNLCATFYVRWYIWMVTWNVTKWENSGRFKLKADTPEEKIKFRIGEKRTWIIHIKPRLCQVKGMCNQNRQLMVMNISHIPTVGDEHFPYTHCWWWTFPMSPLLVVNISHVPTVGGKTLPIYPLLLY